MKKIKLIFISLLAIFGIVTLAGCSSDDNNTDELEAKIAELEADNQTLTDENSELTEKNATLDDENKALSEENATLKNELDELKKKAAFEIKIVDIDDEVLGDKTLVAGAYNSLWDALDTNFDVVATESEYGHYITSINNSVVDSNYFMSIYENGVSAQTGIDGLTIDAGDLFEFKVECFNTVEWGGTFDSYDLLVDKTFYHYAKTYMNTINAESTKYDDSNYWNYMLNNLMIKNGYDKNLFKTLTNESVKNSLLEANVNELMADVNVSKNAPKIGKYYWAAKSFNLDLTSFTEAYQTAINDISTSYSDYVTPFVISPAKALNITSANLTSLIANAEDASTKWGTDGLAWQIASLAMFDKYDKTVLSKLNARVTTYGCTSVAIELQAFAALNVSPRSTEYEVDSKDIIEFLFDGYYDNDMNLIKVSMSDTDVNMSTNQIYASLAAYKVQRDKGASAYLYA